MAYLVYTDRENLLKTIQSGLIRIPRNLESHFQLSLLRDGDTIYLFDFENKKIFGPVKAGPLPAVEEKNPRSGPFNGFGRVKNHYYYRSIHVDCAPIFKKGVPLADLGMKVEGVSFEIDRDVEISIYEKLKLANSEKQRIVINISRHDNRFTAAVINFNKGTSISNFSFSVKKELFLLLERKKNMGENHLSSANMRNFIDIVREIGTIIYDNLLEKLGFERFSPEGSCIIDIAGDDNVCAIPFEIAYKDTFLFEKNIITYRGDDHYDGTPIRVERVLIIADPCGSYSESQREGLRLHDFFAQRRISVDFISRSMQDGMLTDMLSSYDIVHFSGHSYVKEGNEAWDLGGAAFTPEEVIRVGRLPHLVFSSSCGRTLGFGMEFLKAGVKNVVASRWIIPDYDISDFVLNFYHLLFDRFDVGYAFNRALCRSYERGLFVPLTFLFLGESRLIYEMHNS
jgi:hypothetical protein